MNSRPIISAIVACVVLFAVQHSAAARPAHKQALAHYFGPALAKKLNDCRTCHLPEPPGAAKDADDRPHNAFGKRLAEVKAELRKAGKSTTLDARLEAIFDEDSDDDGVSNLAELLAGRFPGDKADRPTDAELAQAKHAAIAFVKLKRGYSWRPFEVVRRPTVPTVMNAGWVRNPIDSFIAAEHEALGLKPRPETERAVLLRRVYLDLIGLPPTADELHEFLRDSAAKPQAAYEAVVDKLLASPQYGERWGRHWMDVWRYSDWAGFGQQVRDSQPHVWRWRDWIVASLNADKGYDRMLVEMLAGDELAPDDPQALAATGYLVRNYKLLSREKWMQDTVEHSFMAFQGLTIQCARCHDHMYDPLLQTDYYQLRAIFEPYGVRTDHIPGKSDKQADGLVRVFDEKLDAKTLFFIRGDDRNPDKDRVMKPAVPEALGGVLPTIQPIKLPRSAVFPDKRDFVVADSMRLARLKIDEADAAVRALSRKAATGAALLHNQATTGRLLVAPAFGGIATEIHGKQIEADIARAKGVALERLLAVERLEEDGKKDTPPWEAAAKAVRVAQIHVDLHETRLTLHTLEIAARLAAPADAKKARERVEDGRRAVGNVEDKLKEEPTTFYTRRILPKYPAESTGRRLAFARWLANRDNPLTARVAVNHLWARHFGQGIVPTVHDFGHNGRPPSHPALLDWLAAEFVERGWSMKQTHKLIVMSSTYRMASTPDNGNAAIDRDNKYLWRYPSRRLEAEAVRDAVFFIGGKLDLTMGGPDIDYPLGLTVPRRSLYFRHAAEKQMEFLQIFDAASVTECYERRHSIVPQQALALMNSEVAVKHARLLARRIKGDERAFTVAAFEHVLSRPPSDAELAECVEFLKTQTQRFQAMKLTGNSSGDGSQPATDPALRARENLAHALVNHHEFVTIR